MTVLRIAHHELRQAQRTHALLVVVATVSLLLTGAGIAGQARVTREQAQRDRFQAMVADQWRAQPDRHPHRVSHYGYLVFRPRAALGFFDSGVESFTGTSLFLEAHRQNSANFSEAAQDSGLRRFGELTMALVLQLLVPLLLFAVAASSVARERETGTLALLLSQATSWRSVLWGKVWGTLLIVVCSVVPGILLMAVWTGAVSSRQWTFDLVVRTMLLAAGHAAYMIACASLAVSVSARHRTARGALVTLIGGWLLLWIIVPRMVPGIAEMLYPLPTRATFEAQVERRVRTLGDSHNPDDPTFAGLRARTLAAHGVARVEDLPVNYNGVVMAESEKLTTDAYRVHLQDLDGIYERQGTVVGLAGFISPYLSMRMLSSALAGVDIAHAIEFERQAEDYRYRLIQHLNTLHTHEVALAQDRYLGIGEDGAPTRQRIGRAHWAATPATNFTQPSVLWALRRQPLAVSGLVWWILLAWGGVTVATRCPPII
jgi:ABC-2 type transport system permease protein